MTFQLLSKRLNNLAVHPTEKLPVVPTERGYTISFKVQFKKVFPIPICGVTLGVSIQS